MAEHTVVCRLQSPSEISPGSDQHRRVRFLDLDLRVVYSTGSAEFAFKIYSYTGNVYAYLLYHSMGPSTRDMYFEAGSNPRCINC